MLRAYKYRMYPTETQIASIWKHIDTCRFLYNYSLEQKLLAFRMGNTELNAYALCLMLPKLKSANPWMYEVNSQSLQAVNTTIEVAFKNFSTKKSDFPQFKSKKHSLQAFKIPQRYKVNFDKNTVTLPKIGEVKTVIHRRFSGALKSSTVSVTKSGKYFISVLVEDGLLELEKVSFTEKTTVGIDVGINSFLVSSDGQKIDNPKYLKKSIVKLARLRHSASKKVTGSNNRRKVEMKITLLYEHISNQRKDFLHKQSCKLICDNQAIAIETLDVKGMLKNHYLSRSILDVSWSEFFRQLEYKSRFYGKNLLKIGQFEPSSKLCSKCGYINNELKLNNRKWLCPVCGMYHDRDVNAAINIKAIALNDNLVYSG